LERAPTTGRLHYKCRISLKEKKRMHQVVLMFRQYHALITHTSSENCKNGFYVTDEDTRIEGPWTESSAYVPKHLRYLLEYTWYPFQQTIIDSVRQNPDESINWLIDPKGCTGKTAVRTYLEIQGLSHSIPPLDRKDLSWCVYSLIQQHGVQNCFIIDMPRACFCEQETFSGLYTTVEEIKDGFAFSSRGTSTITHFPSPHIWIFASFPPNLSLISLHRWRFWKIDEQTRLVSCDDEVLRSDFPALNAMRFHNTHMGPHPPHPPPIQTQITLEQSHVGTLTVPIHTSADTLTPVHVTLNVIRKTTI
jgi:hypothetical protein